MIEITLKNESGEIETITTEGCLVLYFDKDSNIKTSGKINMKALTPLITKLIMEKMTR